MRQCRSSRAGADVTSRDDQSGTDALSEHVGVKHLQHKAFHQKLES
ncbi:hypothetical protein [Acetobacter thailandicus]|nr:hypothetical protein [Acetobacter thailandicus]MBS0961360.1 hypothetical protein [Acetobacter thailandicus]